jgi:hypothetical protein
LTKAKINFSLDALMKRLIHDGIFSRAVVNKLNLERDSIVSISFSFKTIDMEHQKFATLSYFFLLKKLINRKKLTQLC